MDAKTFHSLEEFSKMQQILLYYGIDIPLEDLQNIEILEKKSELISYWNKRTNEIITSNLLGRVLEKYDTKFSVGLTISNLDKTFFVEHFNSIKPARTYEEAGKNTLESRNNPESKLLSRAYADVDTKYGNFCLHIEQGYTDYKFGPYRQVYLYYGNHEQVMIPWSNDFDFHKYCLFKCKYIEQDKFNQWMMGYVNEDFDGPKRSIWNYGQAINKNEKCDLPIYACETRTSSNQGVIIINGDLKLKENVECIPEIFDHYERELDAYESLDCSSKAYFGNYGEYVAILKQGYTITIEYQKQVYRTREWNKDYFEFIESITNKEFTCDDFKKIITKIGTSSLSENIKNFIVSELKTYINIHDEQDFDKFDACTLESFSFEELLEYIKQQNLTELIEKSLESMSEIFQIDIEEVLGTNAPNQQKESQNVKKITKK